MEKYKDYEKFKNEFLEANNWVNNKNNNDSQSGSKYSLHNISFSADYCGQAYAGANNYHHSPKTFNEYVSKVIKKNHNGIFSEALGLMRIDLDKKLILCEEEVISIKKNIENAKIELSNT